MSVCFDWLIDWLICFTNISKVNIIYSVAVLKTIALLVAVHCGRVERSDCGPVASSVNRGNIVFYCPGEATAVLLSPGFFLCFSVNTMTREPLHLARWNFPRTCTLTTSRTLLNFKVTWFFVSLVCMILLEPFGLDSRKVIMSFARWRHYYCRRAVLSLEQGLTILWLVVGVSSTCYISFPACVMYTV